MKRKIALFTCGILTASLLFAGCSPSPAAETSSQVESSASESSSEIESTSVESASAESTTTESVQVEERHLDAEWLKKVTDLYNSQCPENDYFVEVFADGIRGNGSYHPDFNDTFAFYYRTMEGSWMRLNINPYREMASIDLDISYGEGGRMYTEGKYVGLGEIEAYVDALAAGTAKYNAYDSSAMDKNAENLKKDVQIMYARLIVLSDNAFPELNSTLEDYGIDLGDKYRDFDPKQAISTETVITNEHNFVNGVCKDCGMIWTKYMNRTLAAFEGETVAEDAEQTDWFSTYGQDSSYGELLGKGYVQYSSDDVFCTDMLFHLYGDPGKTFTARVYQQESDKYFAHLRYDLDEKFFSIGGGVLDTKYNFRVTLSANLGEFDKAFASKEAFLDACSISLSITNETDSSIIFPWREMENGKMTEDAIRKMFEADGCTYYTQEELINVFWEDHVNLLKALDAGMEWFDTTLEDAGINYQ